MLDQDDSATEALAQCLALARQARPTGDCAQIDLGLQQAQRAWELARQLGYAGEQVEAGLLRAYFMFRRGELVELLRAGDALLPLLRSQSESGHELFELLRWMTVAGLESCDFDTAVYYANEGCARARALGDDRQTALSLIALGAALERIGDPWQAERVMTEAAALVRERATPYERVVVLNSLSEVTLGMFYLLRDSSHDSACAEAAGRALRYARDAQQAAQAHGDPLAVVTVEGNLGEALLHTGQLDEAEPILLRAQHMAEAQGFEIQARRLLCGLGELELARGRAAEAQARLKSLLQVAHKRLPCGMLERTHHALYRCCQLLGQNAEALQHHEAYLAVVRRRTVRQLTAQSRYFATRLEAEQQAGSATGGQATSAVYHAPSRAELEIDPLTGLGQRHSLELRLPALVRAAESAGQPLTLGLISIDHFGPLGEAQGQALVEQVLGQLGQLLRDGSRSGDLLLRHGEGEFMVLFTDTAADRAFDVCERLRQNVEAHPWQDLAPGLAITLSVGLACTPPHATDLLIAQAGKAVNRARYLGCNRVALA